MSGAIWRIGSYLHVWPHGGASLGITNVKEDVFNTVARAYPDKFEGSKWSDLAGDDGLDLKVTAYYQRYLRDKYVTQAPSSLRSNYSDEQIIQGIYNIGVSNYEGTAAMTGQFGALGTKYINNMSGFMAEAQPMICQVPDACH